MTMHDLSDVDPPLICWGRHSQSNDFNEFFGLKLTGEGWTSLFEGVMDTDLSNVSVHNDVVCQIRRSIASSILKQNILPCRCNNHWKESYALSTRT